ncbi:hypothetical protein HZU75_06415 [Chitinibacter fontanus]|uniref:Uncharacterized protein n=1 Tax=Chitinibacter fontanus TaxID=1737446 RepID=A0A7D5VA60_9NEIS|nr:hypothetical protein [Chitinibacter fontanus]QLI81193.1 hypothetical protein HZU75_06415 [Chitinibacter fontanus]
MKRNRLNSHLRAIGFYFVLAIFGAQTAIANQEETIEIKQKVAEQINTGRGLLELMKSANEKLNNTIEKLVQESQHLQLEIAEHEKILFELKEREAKLNALYDSGWQNFIASANHLVTKKGLLEKNEVELKKTIDEYEKCKKDAWIFYIFCGIPPFDRPEVKSLVANQIKLKNEIESLENEYKIRMEEFNEVSQKLSEQRHLVEEKKQNSNEVAKEIDVRKSAASDLNFIQHNMNEDVNQIDSYATQLTRGLSETENEILIDDLKNKSNAFQESLCKGIQFIRNLQKRSLVEISLVLSVTNCKN